MGRLGGGLQPLAMALVDLGQPDGSGIDLIGWLRARSPARPILVVSAWSTEEMILGALRAGANGYVLKERDDLEIALSVRNVLKGGAPIDPFIARRILDLVGRPAGRPPSQPPDPALRDALTEREREILDHVAAGRRATQPPLLAIQPISPSAAKFWWSPSCSDIWFSFIFFGKQPIPISEKNTMGHSPNYKPCEWRLQAEKECVANFAPFMRPGQRLWRDVHAGHFSSRGRLAADMLQQGARLSSGDLAALQAPPTHTHHTRSTTWSPSPSHWPM